METIIGSRPGDPGGNGGQNAGPVIVDATIETFARDVIEGSMQVPVLVDFWAPWCGPCKQLTPALEKLVLGLKGAVRLVKVNVDENQMLAQQLRIQSVPTVMAFKNGRPVDGFQGALPESQLKQFIAALVGEMGPSPVEEVNAMAAEAMAAGKLEDAAAMLSQVLAAEPGNGEAIGRLAQILIRQGDLAGATELLDSAPADQAKHKEIESARAALALAEDTRDAGRPEDFEGKVAANPDDHQARFDLALALTKAGDYDAAADALVEIIRRDRGWNDDAARKQLVKMFDAFGQTSRFTIAARRKLSSVLFS